MNCAEVQQHLPEMIDGSQDATYQAHLKSCSMCSDLVSDLQLIASESHQLRDADEPPQRVWVKIAAELRAEGIIRDAAAPGRPVLVPSPKRRWNAWWLVPVAAAFVAAGAYFIQPKSAVPVARQNPPASVSKTDNAPVVATNETPRAEKAVAVPQNQKTTTAAATQNEPSSNAPLITASTSDQKLLEAVSPDMRSAYETQLRAVNAYIQDAEAYVKRNPDDEDARQHLMGAYEQREMLYQMALDHVQ